TKAPMLNEHEVKALLTDPMTDWFYLGKVSDGFIDSFIGLLDAKPVFKKLSRSARRKLMQALVEALQNIRNNTPEDFSDHRPEAVVFMQRKENNIWMLRCGNVMRTAEVPALRLRLEDIETADETRLKEMYMNQMSLTLSDANRKSAGLGLIEMARSASAPISYKFVTLTPPYTFFAVELQLTLD
ncbi:MAG: SiaB family protein kinase, partial [Bacteroidia bacterium]